MTIRILSSWVNIFNEPGRINGLYISGKGFKAMILQGNHDIALIFSCKNHRYFCIFQVLNFATGRTQNPSA